MDKPYRFTHRNGHHIQVMFRHIPGKWFTTRTDDKIEAVRFAEKMMLEETPSRRKGVTLRTFSQGFFTPTDPQGYRKRNDRRNLTYKNEFYMGHQGRLDNYVLPRFGDYLIGSITDVMVEDWFLDLKTSRSNEPMADDSKNKVLFCLRIILKFPS